MSGSAQRKIAILLTESNLQAVEQALLDRDGAYALEFLEVVVKPQMDVQAKGHCRPIFEWESTQRAPVQPSISHSNKGERKGNV